ncbi:hypothetical protein PHMEG_00022637 [Phytophthora megakarya]|uniref:Uncharacterized protein n=1 Tax=Phytophthora megakarya TaxID=4795 RepID=A0A225VI63_9STRA|nr:hypothetical protein PHMEG_00022637 [Phytophthora megakarya]
MKGRAVKVDSGEWSIVDLDVNDWAKMMQFKLPNRHLVDTERTEHQWNLWLSSVSVGNITQLYVYEYGSKIKTLPVLAAFKKACIDPVRNLNHSTWDAAIAQPPPEYVARLFHRNARRSKTFHVNPNS